MLLEARTGKQRESAVSAVVTDQTTTALMKSLDAITARLERLESRLDGRRVDCDVSKRDNARYSSAANNSTTNLKFRGRCFECGEIGHSKSECPAKAQQKDWR